MSSDDFALFIRAILGDPEDDGPRLAFSDWLEESGDLPRAEALRLGVAVRSASARESYWPGMRRELLEARLDRIDTGHSPRWSRDLPKVGGVSFPLESSGGLFESITIDDPDSFVAHSSAILAAQPVSRLECSGGDDLAKILGAPGMEALGSLHIEGGFAAAESVARSDHLTRLGSLTLSRQGFDDGEAEVLARANHLRTLAGLDLRSNGLGERGAASLARSTSLQNLRRLHLDRNVIGNEGASALASGRFEHLQVLELVACGIREAGARAIAEGESTARLVRLNLATAIDESERSANILGPGGVAALAGSGRLARLEWLDLSGTAPGRAGPMALGRAEHWERLRTLRLTNGGLGAREVECLAQATWMGLVTTLVLNNNELFPAAARILAERSSSLEVLGLARADLGDLGATYLARSGRLAGLRELDLSGNSIGDEGAIALANSDAFPRLVGLDLSRNRIGPEGARVLAASSKRERLEILKLSGNAIGDEGVRAFADSVTLGKLRRLDLGCNEITIRGARTMAVSPLFKGLVRLDLGGNAIKAPTMSWLGRRLGYTPYDF